MILFGTNRPFDLRQIPFSRAGAFLSVYQNPLDNQLYLTHCRCEAVVHTRPNLMRIALMEGDKELPFLYEADEARLTVSAGAGTAAFTYDGAQVLRVRVRGVSLRIFYEPEMHEGADVRAADELEIGLNFIGKLLFKGISGEFATTASWNFREVRPFPLTITLTPGEDSAAELAIHEYESSGLPYPAYRRFEEAEAETRASFETFLKVYPEANPIYALAARRCAWVVWMSQMGPRGSLQETVIFMHKLLIVRAAGWQQCYAAMAMRSDVKRAWAQLLAFFSCQDAWGGLPDTIGDANQEIWVSTKPPLFGVAVCHILENFDTAALTEFDYQTMYDKLSAYRDWWFTHHDHAGTGFPAYYHPDESGYDEASIFYAGLPLQSPDLLAYMVALDDALSRLAQRLHKPQEAERWAEASDRTLRYLTETLWDGEEFLAKVVRTGELVKSGSAAHVQPLVLGKRLSGPILQKLKRRVLDETQFLTDFGVASENMNSPHFTMNSFTRGPVLSPVNFQIITGLYDAGETEAAKTIAVRFLNALLIHGLVLGVSPFRVDPADKKLLNDYSLNQIGAPLTSWGASVFLALANRLIPAQTR
ncbi:MAG: hypothetical protein LLF96_12695 [Eubacteriales bacterium]|nr:hypothetical protein [Eubacteriales bacterium]